MYVCVCVCLCVSMCVRVLTPASKEGNGKSNKSQSSHRADPPPSLPVAS